MLHLTFIWAVLLYLNTTVLPTSVMVAVSILYVCWAVAGLVCSIVKAGFSFECVGTGDRTRTTPRTRTHSSNFWFPFAADILTLVYAFSIGWHVPVLIIILLSLLILAGLIAIVSCTIAECQE